MIIESGPFWSTLLFEEIDWDIRRDDCWSFLVHMKAAIPPDARYYDQGKRLWLIATAYHEQLKQCEREVWE